MDTKKNPKFACYLGKAKCLCFEWPDEQHY